MAEESNKPRAGRRGGRARAQKAGGMLANLHGKSILVEKESYGDDGDGGVHASSHVRTKTKSSSRQKKEGQSIPDDPLVESTCKDLAVVSDFVKNEPLKSKQALMVSKSTQIQDQSDIESHTPCAKQKKSNRLSTPPSTRRGGKENIANNFSAADADQASYVLSPAESSSPAPPMTSVKIADGKVGGNYDLFLSPISPLSPVFLESDASPMLDHDDDDSNLCSSAQSGNMEDGRDESGSRDSSDLSDDSDDDEDDQESTSEKSSSYAGIADKNCCSRDQSSVGTDNDIGDYESEDEDYSIDVESSDSDDEFEFECDESEKEQERRRTKKVISRGGCSGRNDDSEQSAKREERGSVDEAPPAASTNQLEECNDTMSYILSDKDESAGREMSRQLTNEDREGNECVYENDDESLVKWDSDSNEISNSPCDEEPEPQEINHVHNPPTKSCISVAETSSSVEPSSLDVIDVVDRLFHEVDKDIVTVKDIIKSVANYFDLPKVEKSLKKLIKSRLTVLIQEIEPKPGEMDMSVPGHSQFEVTSADKGDGYDLEVVWCGEAEKMTQLALNDCCDEDGDKQNVSFEKVTCMLRSLLDPHPPNDGEQEISSSTDADATLLRKKGQKQSSAESKSPFSANDFLSPKSATSFRSKTYDDSMMSETLFQNLSPDFSVKSKTPSGNQNDVMSMSNSFGDSIKSKILIEKGKWSLGSQIGAGSFGRVYTGLNAINGSIMAVKVLRIPSENKRAIVDDLQREIDVMKKLRHPNIVRYLGAEVDNSKNILNIFQEWAPGGSISELLKKFGTFSINVVKSYVGQILKGLDYLHSHGIIHRDIKGGNILVSNDGTIKLADFGASKRVEEFCAVSDEMEMTMRGTPYFMAPEVFEEKYGSKADIWSVGGVIYQMLSGSPPWKNMGFKSPIALCMHLKSHDRPPKLPQLNDCNDLEYSLVDKILTACFQRDPSKRPSASELLSHPFLNNSIAHMPKSPGIMRRIATNSPSPSQSSCIDPFGESSDLAFKSPLNKIPEHEALNKSLTDSLCYSLSLQSPLPRFNTKTSADTSSWPDWAKNRYDQENAGQNGTNPYAKKTPSQRTS